MPGAGGVRGEHVSFAQPGGKVGINLRELIEIAQGQWPGLPPLNFPFLLYTLQ